MAPKKSSKVIPFIRGDGSSPADDAEGGLVESGTIGDGGSLHWEVFACGTIHIDDGGLSFRKDCDLFEEALDQVPDDLSENEEYVIEGSGDNDDLVFTCMQGKYRLSVRKRGLGIMSKLREVIGKARGHKSDNSKQPKSGRG